MTNNGFSCGALFSGIGGFCAGFEAAGYETKWATDFDAQVSRTYSENFPDTKFLEEDINDIDFNVLDKVDVLHAGFPCQSFSQAGNRKGFDDPRGQLFNVMVDKIEASSWKPSILVFENSPYIMMGDRGLWFDHIRERISGLGYWFSEHNAITIDTNKNCGLPQRRVRLFMFAVRKKEFDFNPLNFIPPKVPLENIQDFLETDTIHDDQYYLGKENKYGEMLIDAASKLEKHQLVQLRKYYLREIDVGLCPTLTANMGLGGHNVPFLLDTKGLRKLTERECLNLQGFDQDFRFPDKLATGAKYRMIGNSVSPRVAQLIADKLKVILEERVNELDMAI